MAILIYNLSPQLTNYLSKIDSLRTSIMTTSVPHQVETRLRWEAMVEKIYWSLSLTPDAPSKNTIIAILTQKTRRANRLQKDVLGYKKALDYINETWLASSKAVNLEAIKELANIIHLPQVKISAKHLRAKYQQTEQFLEYLTQSNEHPVTQAAIAYIQTRLINPFQSEDDRIARLVGYLFLYKFGYDMRGLLVFDEPMRRQLTALHAAYESVEKYKTLTMWLEFFAFSVGVASDSAFKHITSQKAKANIPSLYSKISSRQRQILATLEEPESKITNREVQRTFKISQITASRDLAKLATMGLIFPHGRGRSVHYVKGISF